MKIRCLGSKVARFGCYLVGLLASTLSCISISSAFEHEVRSNAVIFGL